MANSLGAAIIRAIFNSKVGNIFVVATFEDTVVATLPYQDYFIHYRVDPTKRVAAALYFIGRPY